MLNFSAIVSYLGKKGKKRRKNKYGKKDSIFYHKTDKEEIYYDFSYPGCDDLPFIVKLNMGDVPSS